jgi:hypothetical protein
VTVEGAEFTQICLPEDLTSEGDELEFWAKVTKADDYELFLQYRVYVISEESYNTI